MNWIDRAIGAVAPGAALRRLRQRQALGLMQRAYEGAKTGRRTDGWVTAGSGANAEIAPALVQVTRTLARPGAQQSLCDQGGPCAGQQSGGHRNRSAGESEAKFRCEGGRSAVVGVCGNCDADGLTDFGGLQALVVRTMAESGEVLIRLRERRIEDGLPVPLQLQVLEPDHLDSMKTSELPDGGFIVQGIEFDALGRRRAYWLFPTHPGDSRGSRWCRSRSRQPRCCISTSACGRDRSGACRGLHP